MCPRFVYRAPVDDIGKVPEKAFHYRNAIQVANAPVPGHLSGPLAIAEQRTIDVVELVLRREPQPEVVVDAHPDRFIETAEAIEALLPHDTGSESDEVADQQLAAHAPPEQFVVLDSQLAAGLIDVREPGVDDSDGRCAQ